MEHPWGLEYNENGVSSRSEILMLNGDPGVKCTPDAPTLAVCLVTRGQIPVEVFMAWKRIPQPINCQLMYLYARGKMGTSGRDILTHGAIANGCQFAYFADDDVIPPFNVLYKMMHTMQTDPTIGLITGVYTTKQDPPSPHIYKTEGGGAHWGFSLSPYDPVEDIWGCGAGAMMIRLDALKNVQAPYWAERVETGADGQISVLGHDLFMCRRVAAQGYRVVVDGSLQCDHIDIQSGKLYRLPRFSPPVKRHIMDPRNDAYWMHWWGVTPGGAGKAYYDMHNEVLAQAQEFGLRNVAVINAGSGVLAQLLINIGITPLAVYDQDETNVNALLDKHIAAHRLPLYDTLPAGPLIITEILQYLTVDQVSDVIDQLNDCEEGFIWAEPTELVRDITEERIVGSRKLVGDFWTVFSRRTQHA